MKTVFAAAIFSLLSLGMTLAKASKTSETDFLHSYLLIQESLAADSHQPAKQAAEEMTKAIEESSTEAGLKAELLASANKIKDSKEISEARENFKTLSQAMVRWHAQAKPTNVKVAYCSMAKGSWLQKGEDLANPYYGSKMLRCGEWI